MESVCVGVFQGFSQVNSFVKVYLKRMIESYLLASLWVIIAIIKFQKKHHHFG